MGYRLSTEMNNREGVLVKPTIKVNSSKWIAIVTSVSYKCHYSATPIFLKAHSTSDTGLEAALIHVHKYFAIFT